MLGSPPSRKALLRPSSTSADCRAGIPAPWVGPPVLHPLLRVTPLLPLGTKPRGQNPYLGVPSFLIPVLKTTKETLTFSSASKGLQTKQRKRMCRSQGRSIGPKAPPGPWVEAPLASLSGGGLRATAKHLARTRQPPRLCRRSHLPRTFLQPLVCQAA